MKFFEKAALKRLAKIENQKAAIDAALEYKRLRDRDMNPHGKFDNGGRFYLSGKCSCCVGIRKPSREYPYSEMAHGRSAVHVANTGGVAESDVKYLARMLDAGYTKADLLDASARCAAEAAAQAVDAMLEEMTA